MPGPHLTDADISRLISMPKPLPPNYASRLRLRSKPYSDVHEEAQLEIEIPDTGTFRIILRKNKINPKDFSAILGFLPEDRYKMFRLRRYNGASHKHSNILKKNSFDRCCHIHYATQRYHETGADIDGFADQVGRYGTLDAALECLLDDCNFTRPCNEKMQGKLI